jgi:hypothetical protein
VKLQVLPFKVPCGCVFNRETGSRVHSCAGHQVGNVRVVPEPPLQRARRLTPTPASGEARSPRGRNWQAITWRLLILAGLVLFWLWVGMRLAR